MSLLISMSKAALCFLTFFFPIVLPYGFKHCVLNRDRALTLVNAFTGGAYLALTFLFLIPSTSQSLLIVSMAGYLLIFFLKKIIPRLEVNFEPTTNNEIEMESISTEKLFPKNKTILF